MTGNRSAWLWSAATVGTVSVTGIVINVATDLKSSVLAWIAVIAATIACGIATWAGHTTSSARRVPQTMTVVFTTACMLALILGIFALTSTSGDADTTAAASEQQATDTVPADVPPHVVQEVASYTLIAAGGFCPTADKVDLDTGDSGYGGQFQLGDYLDECDIDGGLAEVILEDDEIHTPDNSRLYLLADNDALGYEECRAALGATEQLSSKMPLTELSVGDQICVKTDEGRIARLAILDMGSTEETKITIQFTTWE
jgi:hypothetical protein